MDSDDEGGGWTGYACIDTTWLLLWGESTRALLARKSRGLTEHAKKLDRRVRALERSEERLKVRAQKSKTALEARRAAVDILSGRAMHARIMVQRARFTNLASRLEREANSVELDEGLRQVFESIGARLAAMPPEQFEARLRALESMDARERANDTQIERVFSSMMTDDTADATDSFDQAAIDAVLTEIGLAQLLELEPPPPSNPRPPAPNELEPPATETPPRVALAEELPLEDQLQRRLDLLRNAQ